MILDYRTIEVHVPALLLGFRVTLLICTLSMSVGVVIGILGCVCSLRKRGAVYRLARAYILIFRATPEVSLIFWAYFVLPIMSGMRLSGVAAGTIALSLVAGAYLAEIFRAGVRAVPTEQFDAARALGLRSHLIWRKVILPQAVRRMMPASINYLTELLKHTSYLAAIGVQELTYQAATLGSETYKYFEFFTAIAIFYFVLVFPLSAASRMAERRMALKTGQ